MGFVESLKGLIYDILHNLDRINVDYITSNGLNPLRIRHDSGGLIEFRDNGKAYYNESEISNIAGGGGDFMADGSVPMTGDLSMNNNNLANVNTVNGRVDSILQITSNYQTLRLNAVEGHDIVMGDPVAMGAHKITGLAAGTANGDAIRYEQLIGAYLPIGGGTLTGNLYMDGSNAMVTGDHGTAAADEVVNVCYGTSATPPTASTTTEGALYIQYTA